MIKTFEQFGGGKTKATIKEYMGYNIADYSTKMLDDIFKEPRYQSTYYELNAFRMAMEFVEEMDPEYYKELLFIEVVDSGLIEQLDPVEFDDDDDDDDEEDDD